MIAHAFLFCKKIPAEDSNSEQKNSENVDPDPHKVLKSKMIAHAFLFCKKIPAEVSNSEQKNSEHIESG
jgi:hypothetical protein